MKDEQKPEDNKNLRKETEGSADKDEVSGVYIRALLSEQQIHQVELEMQNDELQRTKTEAEDALRKYSDLYDFAPVGYLTLDKNGNILEANLTAATMLGVLRSELIGVLFRHYVAPESQADFDGFCRIVYNSDEMASYELTLLRDRKYKFNVLTEAKRSECTSQCQVTIIDISRRKMAEDALQKAYLELEEKVEQRTRELAVAQSEAERRTDELEVLMEAVPTGVFIAHDPQCMKITGNRVARELTGLPPDANISKSAPEGEKPTTWQEMKNGIPIPPDELPPQLAARGIEVRDFEMDVVFTDGTIKTVLCNACPLLYESGKPRGSITVVNDITERKSIERDLATARSEEERSAAEMKSFITSIADGVVLFDTDANIKFINNIGMNLLGLPISGMFEGWLERYRLYDMEGNPIPIKENIVCRALRGETITDMRSVLITPWTKEVTLSISASPVINDEGEIMGATMVFRDQSDRVNFEKERQALLEREQHIADILEKAVIPHKHSTVQGCKFAVRYEPALAEAGIGGDFYDIFKLDDGKVGVLIGDVAGKGLAAAVGVAGIRYSIRSYAYLDPRPSKVMTYANDALCKSEAGKEEFGMFTAFFAVIDTRFGGISYTSGGHEAALLKTADGRIERLEAPGPVMGVIKGAKYKEASHKLLPGDIIVMVTDGITEARQNPISLFGIEGVERYLLNSSKASLDSIAGGILQTAKDHAGGSFTDDAAIVVVSLEHGH